MARFMSSLCLCGPMEHDRVTKGNLSGSKTAATYKALRLIELASEKLASDRAALFAIYIYM